MITRISPLENLEKFLNVLLRLSFLFLSFLTLLHKLHNSISHSNKTRSNTFFNLSFQLASQLSGRLASKSESKIGRINNLVFISFSYKRFLQYTKIVIKIYIRTPTFSSISYIMNEFPDSSFSF